MFVCLLLFFVLFFGGFFVCVFGWLVDCFLFCFVFFIRLYALSVNNIYRETVKVQDKCSDKINEATRLRNDNWYSMNFI
jgi:hypothetical protein